MSDRRGQANAWVKVFELCQELGMELDMDKTGIDNVTGFIRAAHAAGVADEKARCVAVIEAEIYALLAESADRDNEARAGAIHQDIHLLDTLLAKVRQ